MATSRGLRLGEAALAAFVLVLGVFVAVETAMLRTGPGYSAIGPKLFPALVAAGLLLVGVALLYEARAGAVAQPMGFELDLPPALMVTAGLVLQMLLMRPAGFVIASALLFVAVPYAFGAGAAGRGTGHAARVGPPGGRHEEALRGWRRSPRSPRASPSRSRPST